MCGPTYGPGSFLAPPFYHDPAPANPPLLWQQLGLGTATDSLNQDSAPVGRNAVSQDGGAEQNEADQQNGGAQQNEADQQNGGAQQNEADQQNGGAQQNEADQQNGGLTSRTAAQQNEADQNIVVNLSREAQQDVQSIPPAATGAPADAAAMPDNADPKADPTLPTDTTGDGKMAVSGKVGGNGTKSRGGQGGALRSAADQISSSTPEDHRRVDGRHQDRRDHHRRCQGWRIRQRHQERQRQHRWPAPGRVRSGIALGVHQSDGVMVGRVRRHRGSDPGAGVDLLSIAEHSDRGNAKVNVGFSA